MDSILSINLCSQSEVSARLQYIYSIRFAVPYVWVSLGKQKIQVPIAIYKSLVDLASINFRKLFPLISSCNKHA